MSTPRLKSVPCHSRTDIPTSNQQLPFVASAQRGGVFSFSHSHVTRLTALLADRVCNTGFNGASTYGIREGRSYLSVVSWSWPRAKREAGRALAQPRVRTGTAKDVR